MNELHRKQLIRAGLTLIGSTVLLLVWWGSIAPSLLSLDVQTASRYSGFTVMLVLIGCFSSTLLLRHELEQRLRGFIIFWFVGSLFFDVFWEIPLWTISAIHETPHTLEHIHWAIIWWSYSLSDTLYADVTPLMITFEIWWLLGNITGLIGLLKLRTGREKEALLFFILCGALQCYNATVYMFMTVYVDHMEPIATDFMGQSIYWGLNGFWAVASISASAMSYKLLKERMG